MEAEFYLEAWLYCVKHNISINRIKKVGWRKWVVFAAKPEEV